MPIQIREKTIEEITEKLKTMITPLNKIAYLESAVKENFSFEIKRYVWEKLSEFYEEKKLYEKSAKAMANKAGIEISSKEKVEAYIRAAELYSRTAKVEDADEMFVRALRTTGVDIARVKLAMKNIYLISAQQLEKKSKNISSLKFYERLVKMPLDDFEKKQIKEKLIFSYKALGRFKDAELVKGL